MRTSPRHSRSPSRSPGARASRQGPHAISLRRRANWLEHWVQPAIGGNAIDDDRGVPEHAEEQIVILGVEGVDVGVDESLDISGWLAGFGPGRHVCTPLRVGLMAVETPFGRSDLWSQLSLGFQLAQPT